MEREKFMLRRDLAQLAIYPVREETETVPFINIRRLCLEKSSETVYITRNKKLYGVVYIEKYRGGVYGNCKIDKIFVSITGFNIIKTHELFQRNPDIYRIPVIDEEGELLGDYSRRDDTLYVERNQELLMREGNVKKVLSPYNAVYVAEPTKKENDLYFEMLKFLKSFQIEFEIVDKEEIGEKVAEKAVCIFIDEDERKCMQCFYEVILGMYDDCSNSIFKPDISGDRQQRLQLITYKDLLHQVIKEFEQERLRARWPVSSDYDKEDEKAIALLSNLQDKGVNCFGLLWGNEDRFGYSEYWERFNDELKSRLAVNPVSIKTPWSKGSLDEDFFCELYQDEDYKNGKAQKEIFNGHLSFEYKKDICGKYFNASDGRRITCFQPEKYAGTIYLLGVCIFVGRHVEDQFTIGSYLQKKLLDKGYSYKIENYAAIARYDGELDSKLEEIGSVSVNDIVIFQTNLGDIPAIPGISMREIFEKYQIPEKWCMDKYGHCNHKANRLIADSLFEMIEPCLQKTGPKDNNREIQLDVCAAMEEYVRLKYIEQYFSCFSGYSYDTVGAIVMNCNPFSIGHRYLIELAKQQVEFLIVFVIEEDEFIFPFEERFKMVKEGTKDLNNVMVVPSGEFIFSKDTFREYYIKREKEAVHYNAEYDIRMFTDYIAKHLHITTRFAGEELKRDVIKIYNAEMGRILPRKGIQYVEIPKLSIGDEEVNTSKIRKYLKNKDYSKAFTLLPQTTRDYLSDQLNLAKEI